MATKDIPEPLLTSIDPSMPPHPDARAGAEPAHKLDEIPGIIPELGQLGPGAVITERGLAELLKRHPVSIRRAVEKGQLPAPFALLNTVAWTVGRLVRHFEDLQERAAKERRQTESRLAQLRP